MNPSYISRQHLNFEIDKFGLKETVLKWLYLDSYSGGSVTYRIYLKPFWRQIVCEKGIWNSWYTTIELCIF